MSPTEGIKCWPLFRQRKSWLWLKVGRGLGDWDVGCVFGTLFFLIASLGNINIINRCFLMEVSLIEQININYFDRYQKKYQGTRCPSDYWLKALKLQRTYMYRQRLSWSMLERRNKRGLRTDNKELEQRKACMRLRHPALKIFCNQISHGKRGKWTTLELLFRLSPLFSCFPMKLSKSILHIRHRKLNLRPCPHVLTSPCPTSPSPSPRVPCPIVYLNSLLSRVISGDDIVTKIKKIVINLHFNEFPPDFSCNQICK